MLFRILSFNVGVEIGQIVALTAMLILLSGWRKAAAYMKFAKAANVGLIAGGVFLFFMQFHGYWHGSDPDAFPLNRDDHSHVHQDMQQEEMKTGDVGEI
jgi:hypothetical protein